MKRTTTKILSVSAMLGLVLTACGDDTATPGTGTEDSDSGFEDDDAAVDASSGGSNGPASGTAPSSGPSGSDGPPDDPGTDDGEPPGPGDGEELCDAGDESFVKRLIPFAQGRRPEGMAEVRLLVSMIEQLDTMGVDGRRAVTQGLLRGDHFYDRWSSYMYEELRVNLAGDRRNEECYDLAGTEGDSTALAEFIRDNDATDQYPGELFWMPDVVQSALRLDDVTPIYRADLFARMSAPIIAANVTPAELEEMRVLNFGATFEGSFLGRNTECLMCHTTEDSITFSTVEESNRHWPIPGEFELGVYGPTAKESDHETSYGIFRFFNFAVSQEIILNTGMPAGYVPAFGFGPSCGGFRFAPGAPGLNWDPYMVQDFPPGATIGDLDQTLRAGFDELRGREPDFDGTVSGEESAAYLFSMNFANRMWTEGMGFPLTVANAFPRNPSQRDILESMADTLVSSGYSLRAIATEVVNHPYFNQSPPAECGAATPYHMPAVFDPFTKEAADPALRPNGVGDTVHRYGAFLLLDSLAQSMWWSKPERFGPGDDIPEANCGGDMPMFPCDDEPRDASTLRDLGAFLSDSDSGFEGTDLLALLRLENEVGQGDDPSFFGACTGPLGQACASDDWIGQLIDGAGPEADMWDVASAVKDRLITEPTIYGDAEVGALETVMGVSLTDTVASDPGAAEQGARLLAGMLMNTPQFLLAGVVSKDQEAANDPVLVVDGTDTEALCNYLAPLVLDNAGDGVSVGYQCSGDGVTLR